MSQQVFRPHPPNTHGQLIGPTSTYKYKRLQQLRSSKRKSSTRHIPITAHPSQAVQNQESTHQITNQSSISVAKSVTTITLNNNLHKSNNSANQKEVKTVSQEYRHMKIIGQGAFGVVYCARMADGKYVAIKKVLQDPHFINREYDILKTIDNKYCVKMINFFKSSKKKSTEEEDNNNCNKDVYLNIVMNYMPQNLHDFNQSYKVQKSYPPIIMAKLFTYQIFLGLNYLHSPEINITHRDLKPRNILIDPNTGKLNICDFGSAKKLSQKDPSVSYIASRYYRAPELMMNCTNYTNKIDIWAAGCIFAEILTAGVPIFKGNTSMGQLYEIIRIIGQPTDEDFDSFQYEISDFDLLKIRSIEQSDTLKSSLPPHTPNDVVDLLTEIFQFNPEKRPSANQCLRHRCFDELFQQGIMLPNKRPIPPIERPI